MNRMNHTRAKNSLNRVGHMSHTNHINSHQPQQSHQSHQSQPLFVLFFKRFWTCLRTKRHQFFCPYCANYAGSIRYSDPDTIIWDLSLSDPSTDVYALGVTYVLKLSSEDTFSKTDVLLDLQKILQGDNSPRLKLDMRQELAKQYRENLISLARLRERQPECSREFSDL